MNAPGSFPGYLRWSVYGLLIAVSVGAMTARVMQVESSSKADPSPFLSANDRSRRATIRALVDEGTYAIDNVIFKSSRTGSRAASIGDPSRGAGGSFVEENRPKDRVWHSIDIVYHKSSDGQWHYFSS